MQLYNKYRPTTLDGVVGNYSKFLNSDTHTYLFVGPSGTGKTTTAYAFANSLGVSEHEVEYINASNKNGVDDARELVDKSMMTPLNKWVFIIDEVHKATNAFFECLLNPIEFTGKDVYWIFCTSEPYKLQDTFTSRCKIVNFKPHSFDNIMGILKDIVGKEGYSVKSSVLADIADNCKGNARTAINTLQSVSAFTDVESIKEIIDNMEFAEADEDIFSLVKYFFSSNRDWTTFMTKLEVFKKSNKLETIRQTTISYGFSILKKNRTVDLIKRLDYFSSPWYDDGYTKAVLAFGKAW